MISSLSFSPFRHLSEGASSVQQAIMSTKHKREKRSESGELALRGSRCTSCEIMIGMLQQTIQCNVQYTTLQLLFGGSRRRLIIPHHHLGQHQQPHFAPAALAITDELPFSYLLSACRKFAKQPIIDCDCSIQLQQLLLLLVWLCCLCARQCCREIPC